MGILQVETALLSDLLPLIVVIIVNFVNNLFILGFLKIVG